MTTVDFPLIHNADPLRFRFTVKTAREWTRAGGSLNALRTELTIDQIVLLVQYALKWADPKMTDAKAESMVQAFIDAGGDVAEVASAVLKAMNRSGIWGRVEEVGEDDPANPQTAPADAPTT